MILLLLETPCVFCLGGLFTVQFDWLMFVDCVYLLVAYFWVYLSLLCYSLRFDLGLLVFVWCLLDLIGFGIWLLLVLFCDLVICVLLGFGFEFCGFGVGLCWIGLFALTWVGFLVFGVAGPVGLVLMLDLRFGWCTLLVLCCVLKWFAIVSGFCRLTCLCRSFVLLLIWLVGWLVWYVCWFCFLGVV